MATWKKLITESDIPTTIVSSVNPGDGLQGTSSASGAGVTHTINVVGGDGLDVGPNIVNLDIDGSTLTKDSDGLRVNAEGITNAELDVSVITGFGPVAGLTNNDTFLIQTGGNLKELTAAQIATYVSAEVGNYTIDADSTITNNYDWADIQIKLEGPSDSYVYLEAYDTNFQINEVTHEGGAEKSIAFSLKDNVTIDGRLVLDYVDGTSGAALTVDGPSQFNDNVSVGTAQTAKNLTVWGNLTVQGTQTVLNTETLTVDDQVIVINDNASDAVPLSGGGGIQVNVDSDAEARLLYNNTYGNGGTTYQTGWRATRGADTDAAVQYNGTDALVHSVVMTMDFADTDDVPVAGDDDAGLGQMVFVDRTGGAVGDIYVRVA